ncbi:MAG: nitrilase-related carbon-nitrogen hydrolase [Bacteroidota bacterium]
MAETNSKLHINVFQFDIQWLDAKKNISLIENHLKSLSGAVDLVVLPEMYLSGFCMEASKSAIIENGKEINELIDLADRFNVALIGSLAISEDKTYYNRVLLLNGDGVVARYDKQRLYSPSGEHQAFDRKYDVQLIEFKEWKILPQVCYDLRFPENVRPLSPPDLLLYMANWPTPRIHHWNALLKARAIENQCFTIGCNRVGVDNNTWEYPGHSIIFKSDGTEIRTIKTNDPEVVALEMTDMIEYRQKYQFLNDK